LKYASDDSWGFITLTIDENKISGVTTQVARDGTVTSSADTFSYTAKPIILADPKSVPTL
jgi:acid phosphatase type 7